MDKAKKKNITIDHTKVRKNLAIICTVIIGMLATAIISAVNLDSKSAKYLGDMAGTLAAAANEYNKNVKMDECYMECMESVGDSLAGYTAFYFNQNGYTIATRESVTDAIGDVCLIYYYHGFADSVEEVEKGYTLSDKELKYELNSEQTYELLKNGRYQNGEAHFSSHRIDSSSYAIVRWCASDIFIQKSILSAYSQNRFQYVYRINNATGIIEDSSEPELVGLEYHENINTDGFVQDDEYGYLFGFTNIEGKGKCIVLMDNSIDGQTLFCYIPFAELKYDFGTGVLLPVIFLWAFLVMIMVYVIRFIKNAQGSNDGNSEYIHIAKDLYIDGRLASHNIGLALFAGLVTVLSVLYFQTLLNYSSQDTNALRNLESFNSFLDNAQSNAVSMDEDFLDMQGTVTDAISKYFMRYPHHLSDSALSKMSSFMPGVMDIAVIDNTGTIEFDSGNNQGYTISHDENSLAGGEYGIWSVVDGLSEITGYYDYLNGSYYAATRRQDKNGAIRIQVPYGEVFEVLKLMQPEETLRTADFGYASRALIVNAMPENLYYSQEGSDEVKKVPNNLPENVLVNGYSGVSRYTDGEKYFINVRTDDNYVLISAVETKALYGELNYVIYIVILLSLMAQTIALVLIGIHRRSVAPENTVVIRNNPSLTETLESQAMDNRFRTTLRNMSIVTSAIIGTQLIADYINSDCPIIKYLFSSSFSRGFNLFSLTMIIIVVVVGMLGGSFLQVLLIFFTKSMGPRGLTIGRMMSSLLRFLILLITIVLCLTYVGVNPGTLLAGAGVVGALISFCAQQTVNDMLSGFFMVFENQFNIGDWITVDDFSGQVVEIGIRTTKLQKQETFKVYNNNEIRRFTIAEYWDRGAVVEIDIAYKEDATAVIKLLTDNADKIKSEISFITDGPNVAGVTNLSTSGVTLRIRAICDVTKVLTVERELRRVIKRLFDENNIEIPFNQVTLHADEDISIMMKKEKEKNE